MREETRSAPDIKGREQFSEAEMHATDFEDGLFRPSPGQFDLLRKLHQDLELCMLMPFNVGVRREEWLAGLDGIRRRLDDLRADVIGEER